jgi:DNA-directed RNA polymerase subunit RPC12/RpoP
MSMKNPHIIHKVFLEDYYYGKPKFRYFCIRCVDPTPAKSSQTWKKVTCKNCLKRRMR